MERPEPVFALSSDATIPLFAFSVEGFWKEINIHLQQVFKASLDNVTETDLRCTSRGVEIIRVQDFVLGDCGSICSI